MKRILYNAGPFAAGAALSNAYSYAVFLREFGSMAVWSKANVRRTNARSAGTEIFQTRNFSNSRRLCIFIVLK
jgi:hypothetical protein